MNNDYFKDLNLILNKLADFTKMDPLKKDVYFSDIKEGFIYSLIAQANGIVTTEVINKIKTSQADDVTIKAFVKEFYENPNGKSIFNSELNKMVASLIDSVKDDLTQDQKIELTVLLQQDTV